MKFRGAMVAAGIALGVFAVGMMVAREWEKRRDVSEPLHPNLDAAQDFVDLAFIKVAVAKRANEWDWDGHAARAQDLLTQANSELKQAAEAASRIRRQITLLTPPIPQSKISLIENLDGPRSFHRVV